jgi:hypothetical protein
LQRAEAERVRAESEARTRLQQQEAEARRLADASAAQKRVAEERAAEMPASHENSRIASVRAEDERRAQEADAARLRLEAEAAERQRIAAASSKPDEQTRSAGVTLTDEQRAAFIKKVQEVLKANSCYGGEVNGIASDAQNALDRYVDRARRGGREQPSRIELAKAGTRDFDTWLREANLAKEGVCTKPAPPVARRPAPERPRYSSPPQRRFGTGGGASAVQGIR